MIRYYQIWVASCILAVQSALGASLLLPDNLIALDTRQGQIFFQESTIHEPFWRLSESFVTQENQTYCGIASAVMALNALSVAAPVDPVYAPYPMFTQNNFFTSAVLKIVMPTQIGPKGIALDTLASALNTFPVKATAIHTDNIDQVQFQRQLIHALSQPDTIVLVDFLRTSIGQVGTGHISPVAAYDHESDRFLIMDVARYKYTPFWVSSDALWAAINTVDEDVQQSRGYILIEKSGT